MSEQRNIILAKVRLILGACKDYQYWMKGYTIDSIPKDLVQQCKALGFEGYTLAESQMEVNASIKTKEYKSSFNHMSKALTGFTEYRFPAGASFEDVTFDDDFIVYSNGRTHLVSDTNPMTKPEKIPVVNGQPLAIELPRVTEEEKFIGEMILFTQPEKGKIVPKATVDMMAQAGIREAKSLEGFCSVASGVFGLLPNPCSPPVYFKLIKDQLALMTHTQQVEFKTIFYNSRYPVNVERVGQYLRPSVPVWSGLRPYYRDPQDIAANPDQSTFLSRFGNIKDTLVQPKTTAGQISFLTSQRSIRGNDMSHASFYASATSRGGYVEKQRRQICDILSVIIPLHDRELKKKKEDPSYKEKSITVRPHVDSLIPELTIAVAKYSMENHVKFFSQVDDLIDRFPKSIIRSYEKESILVDFVEGRIPTFEKKTNPDTVWSDLLRSHVSSRMDQLTEFYLLRKVAPTFSMQGISVFKFHSSHAFDFFITNSSEMRVAYGFVGKNFKIDIRFQPLVIQTTASIRENVFKDNQIRTYAIVNGNYGQDLGLNLYGTECRKLSKKEMRKAVLEFEGDPDDDPEEIEVRDILKRLKIDDDEVKIVHPLFAPKVVEEVDREEIRFDD